ncbi:HK97 family phage prohead protease [Macrococcus carouselicus]|uniref:HK97 family phage prohead protease n=1 Tax=Macrococcus carouselicus TaxID=69969 RepID=A0A9Q8CKJ2_9STAP|nr:HK97 family phage prohead protease [Macrococcus carouselicus]TDM04060.1 HK97 family phage prohead protease [Macrococcus carouselicus]
MSKEIRTLGTGLEVRKLEDVNEMIVEGYALRFNTWSEDLGRFIETITPEALKNTELDDVRLLFNHDWSNVLGRQSAQTLDLEVDEVGLRFKAKLPNTTLGRDVYEQIKANNINQCSFEFTLAENGEEMRYDSKDSIYKRTIKAIKRIREISIVSLPAYKSSDVSIALRSLEETKQKRQLDLVQVELDLLNLKNHK